MKKRTCLLLGLVILTLADLHAQTPSSPCNTQVSISGGILFTWTAGGAQSWELQVDTDPQLFFGEGTVVTNLNSTSYTLTNLLADQTYYWHVRGNSGPSGTGLWGGYGTSCSFTTTNVSAPSAPSLTTPIDNGAGYVPSPCTFNWNQSSGATGYDLQVSTSSTFGTTVVNQTNIAWSSGGHSVTGLLAGQTYYWRMRANNAGGSSSWSSTWVFFTRSVSTALNLKVFLQGPLNTTTLLMNDGLRSSGVLAGQANNQPYDDLGFTGFWSASYTITANLNTTGNDAIVDWIMVELRHATTNVALYKHVMLVQRDGDVVTTAGAVPSLIFPMRDSKVAVRHRNHLAVATASTVSATGTPINLDMTQTSTALYGTEPTATVATTRRALWAGETGNNGQIKYTGSGNDRDVILTTIGSTTPNNTITGQYSLLDTNMDGQLKYTGSGNDRDPILVTVGSTTPNSTRTQQLP